MVSSTGISTVAAPPRTVMGISRAMPSRSTTTTPRASSKGERTSRVAVSPGAYSRRSGTRSTRRSASSHTTASSPYT